MSKASFRLIAIHCGDAGACVILKSSNISWKYWLLEYTWSIAFWISIIARSSPWYIFNRPECIWRPTSCVIGTFLRDRHHDVTSSEDYASIFFPEVASCKQILPEMCFALVCNASSMKLVVLTTYFAGSTWSTTTDLWRFENRRRGHSGDILQTSETM